jgi:superfamily II DNA helicase RecQ
MRDYPTQKILFLSPLRAIAEEMYLKVNAFNISCQFLQSHDELQDAQFYISTIELFQAHYLQQFSDLWIVFDEFHLIYMWESFRPKLTDLWYELVLSSQPLILLSATISKECLARLQSEMNLNERELWALDYGNFKYKYLPKLNALPSERALLLSVLLNQMRKQNALLFCPYRQQVKYFSQQLESFSVAHYHCVGGEAAQFSQQLLSHKAHLVLATSVLSHGVNLPVIKHVYFLQKTLQKELDLQMQTRGGRDGSGYNVYFILKYSPRAWFNYAILVGVILLKIKYWKLIKISKELSLKKFPSKRKISCWWSCFAADKKSPFISTVGKVGEKLIALVSSNWEIYWSSSYKRIKQACKQMFTPSKTGM